MEFRYQYNGTVYVINLEPAADGGYIARIGERQHTVQVERREGGDISLLVDGRRVLAHVTARDNDRTVALPGSEIRIFELARVQPGARRRGPKGGSGGLARQPNSEVKRTSSGVAAQMPGVVRQVFVAEGDAVAEGQPLLLLEAMKMEIRVTAPAAGVVTRLLVKTGDTVERGQELAEISPA